MSCASRPNIHAFSRLRLALFSAALSCAAPARAGDPHLEWYTLETPHFRVHFHGGLEDVAQRAGALAEDAHRVLVPELGWTPREYVHIVLSDTSEFANGSATPMPYNTVRLFVTAPDDMSALADYDDWLDTLITHEYTHILDLDHTAGFSAVVNSIFGKILVPNTNKPRFVSEGLAVVKESEHTTGGRMRSSQFDMMLRMDVLENRLARLDQVSNPALRWPGGNLWYLYGSRFLGFIYDVYGPDVARAVAADYAYSVIPYGINRSVRRVTGRTYEELYVGWRASLERRYAAQAEAVRKRGVIEGARLTESGRSTLRARRAPACFGQTALLVVKDDGHQTAGIYRIPLDPSGQRALGRPELLVRTTGSSFDFDADCNLVYDSLGVSERRYHLFDIYRQPRGTRATRGTELSREQLSHGARFREPDVSPDGKSVVFVENERGQSTLAIARFDAHGRLGKARALARSGRFEQAYTPRFSPDGKTVAYGVWTEGGYRDVRLLDLASGRVDQVTHDRAIDQQPAFSPDGRYLYFTSDRTGIANVYEYEIASRQLSQVTNVLGGAYLPEISEDGRLLYYAGYTSRGFDVFVLPLDRSRNLRAVPPPEDRPRARDIEPRARFVVRPYSAIDTIAPRSYRLGIGTGTFGTTISVSAVGVDAIDRHLVAGNFSIDFTRAIPQGSLTYVYDRLPARLRIDAFHEVVPRTLEASLEPAPVLETLNGVSSGLTYDLPNDFSIHSFAGSYSVQHFDQELDFERTLDPYAPLPPKLEEGQLGVIHAGYGYSNAESTVYATGPEKGFSLGVGADYASGATASDDTLYSLLVQSTGYLLMPWARHHVLALGASGATAGGSYPRRGPFFTGGFVDQGPFEPFISNVRQGAFVLRGYEPGQFSGSSYALFNAEYRLPLLYADRGVSTLPVFLRKMSGVAFADYGGAFDELHLDDPRSSMHLGVGTEVWFDFVLGYFATTNVRIGYAKGLSELAPPAQVYFVAASAF